MILILTVVICILAVLVIIFAFTTINLLRKNEKAEDIIVGYLHYLDRFSKIIEASDTKLKEIDKNQMFEKDDDVGIIFESIKQVQSILNDFSIEKLKQKDA